MPSRNLQSMGKMDIKQRWKCEQPLCVCFRAPWEHVPKTGTQLVFVCLHAKSLRLCGIICISEVVDISPGNLDLRLSDHETVASVLSVVSLFHTHIEEASCHGMN